MNEESARAATLLQAFETAQPPSPNWREEDRSWATRVAMDEGQGDSPEAFIARRSRHALTRLGPLEPAASTWLARRLWSPRWVAWAALAGLMLGLAADSIGSSQHVNLLAPPLWAVLAWNAVVYLLLLGHAMALAFRRPTRPGALVRLTQRLLRFGRRLPGAEGAAGSLLAGEGGKPLQIFGALWLRRSGPLSAARAACLLHTASAALAIGLIGGLYLRGLVLDYRAGWESTFLTAGAAHTALSVALAPASALSGIAMPDLAAFEAMRTAHGSVATVSGASAAPWIHLLAITLALFVVLPRGLLALAGALRAHWLMGHFPLPLGEAYFQRLLRQQQGDVARVWVQPYAGTPAATAAPVLQRMLASVLGDGLQLELAPTAAFGAEDAPGDVLPISTTVAIALFDLAATPEPENQGRFVHQLAARAPAGAATLLAVDETGFRQRFGADSGRLAQRRDTWRRFAESLGSVPVYVDFDAPDLAGAGRAVQLAMRSPVVAMAA
jgi:hypothetical protein